MLQKFKSIFVEFGKYDSRQVNIHYNGRWIYWYIEPNEKPIITSNYIIPEILQNKQEILDILDELNYIVYEKNKY